MRPSSEPLTAAFADGATLAGADVVDLGLISTDLVYFASGRLDAPAAMFTASHNPAQYNGIKLCRAGAAPVGQDTGLAEIQATVASGLLERAADRGRVEQRDLLPEYVEHVHSFVDVGALAPAARGRRHRQRHGRRRRPARVRRPAVRPVGALSGARRDVPEPSRRPDPAREPQGPAAVGARRQRRRRARLRRRRRPRLPRRRPGPAPFRLDHHRDPGERDPRTAPGRDGRAQPHLLEGRAGGRPRDGRDARPHPGRPLLHQAGDGRDRRHLRRRALGALLLPGQLPRRLRPHRRDGRARAAVARRRTALRAPAPLRAVRRLG